MNRAPTLIAALAAIAGFAATTAQAQPGAASADAVKVPESKITRTIDCHGADLTITGDYDKLSISACATINVVGDHNQVRAQLLPTSTIAALGNNNHIVFLHAAGFEAQVTSSGHNNEIVPVMERDIHDVSPVKFPLSSH